MGSVSSALDEDVVRTVDSGRETLGAMIGAAQSHLRKVFVVFVVGLIGTIFALQEYIWDRMKADLNANPDIQIVAVTPFDVILLQVKIGLVVGALLSLPLLIYYARQPLRERGLWVPDRVDVSRGQYVALALVSLVLLVGGIGYAYFLFFPLMLDFLASNATSAGFEPKYSIVMWSQFIFLLSVSFGLAAQLPLVMSGLSYTDIVPYETFRDKWRYAVIGIFAFGALFSPPDPFTQIMWAVPLLFLYGFSLGLARVVTTARVSSEAIGVRTLARRRWNVLVGAFVVVAGGTYLLGQALYAGQFDATLQRLPAPIRPGLFARDLLFGLPVDGVLVVVGVLLGLLVAGVALVGLLFTELEELPSPEERRRGRARASPTSIGTPAALDVGALDVHGVRAAPVEPFVEMTEDEALALARDAMDADDPDKAEAILDRFDEAQAIVEADPEATGATAAAANRVDEDGELEDVEAAEPSTPDPEDVELADLTASGVRNAPDGVFAEMTEDEAVDHAQQAMETGDAEKAEAIFERFDAVQERIRAEGPTGTWGESAEGYANVLRLGASRIDWRGRLGSVWNYLAALAVLVAGGVYLAVAGPALGADGLPSVALPPAVADLASPTVLGLVFGLLAGVLVAGVVAGGLAALWSYRAATDATAVDFAALTVEEVRDAPFQAFFGTLEADVEREAETLVRRGHSEKAQALFDRYEEVEAERENTETRRRASRGASEGGVFSRTGAGMASAFTDDDVDDDDIGGYYYDLAFIFDSITSKTFWLVGWFMAVLAITFVTLYQGGIGVLKNQFYARLPASVRPESVELVTLHPVEALIFEIKVSTIIAAVATLPLLLYYVWPALKERGFASGDRNVLVTWAGTLFGGLLIGSVVGFLFVAPTIISWLAADVIQNEMLIRYRINNFGWLVFFTTVGVGLLLDVPLSMWLFHRGGLVPYRSMKARWREVTIAVLAVAALASPKGIFTMFLLGVPIMASYGLGLAILRLYVAVSGDEGRPPLLTGLEAD
jgi:sec-independent protein translocase protein TatC